jgi:DNA-binding MarR family transcriptional regulator
MGDKTYPVSSWISFLFRSRRKFMGKKLESRGAACGMYMILLAAARNDGASQEQISDLLKIDKTSTAKSVKKLEDEGFVVRKPDCADKRVNRVFLTPKGRGVVPEIESALLEWDRIIRSGISEEDCRRAEEILQRMAENACGEIRKL